MTKKTRQSIFSENMYFTAYSQNISCLQTPKLYHWKLNTGCPRAEKQTEKGIVWIEKKNAKKEEGSVY